MGGLKGETFRIGDYFLILLGGFFECMGMVAQIYAASIGVGGIAFGLANTCCIYVTLFNYLVMGQPISGAQITGIFLTLGGASIIALQEQIYQALFKRKQ